MEEITWITNANKAEEIVSSIIEKARSKSKSLRCVVDVVIGLDVSGSMLYPASNIALAQNAMVIDLINGFAPHMLNDDLQLGIVLWSSPGQLPNNIITNPNTGPTNTVMPWNEGVWLSNDPVALTVLVNNIDGSGATIVQDALNYNHDLLNKAQMDPTNCSLGNRMGQTGFNRVAIFTTDSGFSGSPGLTPLILSLAENYWQTEDIYGIRIAPATMSAINIQDAREKLQPLCGEAGTAINTLTVAPWNSGDFDFTAAGGITQMPGLAQDIWERICPLPSYDCKGNYTCQDPGDGSGQYSVANGYPNPLLSCQQNCIAPSYNCDSNYVCYDPGTGLGTYSVANGYPNPLQACEDNCIPPSWLCSPNDPFQPSYCNCVQMFTDPPQPYSTLQACEDNCMCTTFECVTLISGIGSCQGPNFYPISLVPIGPNIFYDLASCQAACNPSWDCTINGCVDLGTGTGQYSNWSDCDAGCEVWECVDVTVMPGPMGVTGPSGLQCVSRQGGLPAVTAGNAAGGNWFMDYNDCLSDCYKRSWDCIFTPDRVGQGSLPGANWSCVDPLDGSGQYNSLAVCQYNCGDDDPIDPGFDCDPDLGCVPHTGTGQGQFMTLILCQQNCGPGYNIPISWDCDRNYPYGCFDPGTGLGQYTTLVACQTACISPSWDCDGQGNCIDPGTGLGQYPTLATCQFYCKI